MDASLRAWQALGRMVTATELEALMRAASAIAQAESIDGTYVVTTGAERTATGYFRPALTLTRVTEDSGHEIAYDAVSPEACPTEGGARAFLKLGDRFGAWTTPEGTLCIDRTVYLQGGDASIAWVLGETFAQRAIWDWAQGTAIDSSGAVL